MEQGLLFNRIDVEGAGVAIHQRVECAVVVDLVAAMAAVAGSEQAVVGADLALDVAAELEVMGGFLDPAALAPLLPKLGFGGVAFEDVRWGLAVAPFAEHLEERCGAGDGRNAPHTEPDGSPA